MQEKIHELRTLVRYVRSRIDTWSIDVEGHTALYDALRDAYDQITSADESLYRVWLKAQSTGPTPPAEEGNDD